MLIGWFTQIDSDSRYEVGREAEVNKLLHEVDEFAEAIDYRKHLTKLKKIKFVIIHPLLKNGFESLVQILNTLPDLEQIIIERPNDTETYYV